MKEFADFQEIETVVAQFVTYDNQYRAHGGIGYVLCVGVLNAPINWGFDEYKAQTL